MGEKGKHPAGADVGGIRSTADGGLADALQAEAERKDAATSGRAATGDASGSSTGPVLDAGGKREPGSSGGAGGEGRRSAAATPSTRASTTPAPSTGAAFDDEEDAWRHAPVEPRDESNPLKSLGKAVGDTVTGSEGSAPGGMKPTGGKS